MNKTTAIMKYEGSPCYVTTNGKRYYQGWKKSIANIFTGDGMVWFVKIEVNKSGKTYLYSYKQDKYATNLRYYLRKNDIDIPYSWGTREELKVLIKKHGIKCSMITPQQKKWFVEHIAKGRSMISGKPIKRGDIHHLRYGYDDTDEWWRHVIYCTRVEHQKIHGKHKSGEIIKVDIAEISKYWENIL